MVRCLKPTTLKVLLLHKQQLVVLAVALPSASGQRLQCVQMDHALPPPPHHQANTFYKAMTCGHDLRPMPALPYPGISWHASLRAVQLLCGENLVSLACCYSAGQVGALLTAVLVCCRVIDSTVNALRSESSRGAAGIGAQHRAS